MSEGGDPAAHDPRDRGFRDRKREDHALALIDQLFESLTDLPRVRRILLELGRFYDPILGGAIVDVDHQRAIVDALECGQVERAQALIQNRYDLYIKDRAHLKARSEPPPPDSA